MAQLRLDFVRMWA